MELDPENQLQCTSLHDYTAVWTGLVFEQRLETLSGTVKFVIGQ